MPRWVYLVCAWLFAVISVALAARYGFKGADTSADGLIYGTMFGAIAAGGGLMQALAVHVATSEGMTRRYRMLWAVVIAVIGLAAMFATVLSSLGAIAGRADAIAAERTSAADNARDDRATLKRLTDERAGLKFAATDTAAVDAAKAAVASAERSRVAECGNGDPKQRGANCRARETVEQDKRDALAAVVANKALTDRAANLDADLATIRARLVGAAPAQTANPLAATLSRMLDMSVSDAADRRDLFLAIVLELLVAGSMIGVELTRDRRLPESTKETGDTPVAPSAMTGSVVAFFAARLPEDATGQASMREIFDAYKAWCAAASPALAPLPVELFGRQFGAECKRRRIEVRRDGKTVLCVGVRLVA